MTPRTWTASSRGGTPSAAPTTWPPGSTTASRCRRRPATPRPSPARPTRSARARPSHHLRDPTLQDPRCVFQILRRHFARYTPEMVEEACGIPPERVPARGRGAVRQLRPRAHLGLLLRGGLDPALGGRPVHPHRGDPAAAARATSAGRAAASWRCAGTPRSRARRTSRRSTTCCRATCRCRGRRSTARFEEYVANHGSATGWWAELPALHRLVPAGLVGRRRDGRERLVLRPPAAPLRRPLPHDHGRRDGRGARCGATS